MSWKDTVRGVFSNFRLPTIQGSSVLLAHEGLLETSDTFENFWLRFPRDWMGWLNPRLEHYGFIEKSAQAWKAHYIAEIPLKKVTDADVQAAIKEIEEMETIEVADPDPSKPPKKVRKAFTPAQVFIQGKDYFEEGNFVFAKAKLDTLKTPINLYGYSIVTCGWVSPQEQAQNIRSVLSSDIIWHALVLAQQQGVTWPPPGVK